MERSEQEVLERLGRQRPAIFKSATSEWGFCFSVAMSQLLTDYFVSGFPVIVPKLVEALGIPEASQVWPASAFSLVVSSFLLIFSRVGDIFGGKRVYLAGTAWLAIFALATGFSPNTIVLTTARAIAGLGPAAYLPTSLMQLGAIYRPGPRKNFVFSIYGACAPLGFFLGIFVAAVAAHFDIWPLYFWVGSGLATVTSVVGFFCIPGDSRARSEADAKMDWAGSLLIAPGLVLTVFAVVDSAYAPRGWATPYICVSFALGITLLLLAAYVEGVVLPARDGAQPLLPPDLFRIKGMKPLVLGLFLFYSGSGLFWFYSTFYMRDVMGASPLLLVAWFLPSALGGLVVAPVGGLIMHRVSGRCLILFAGINWIAAPLLFALMPAGASYWHFAFFAMLCTTFGLEPMFNAANIFITTALPQDLQGLAGGLANSLLQLSTALFLGLANLVVTGTADQGEAKSYKNAFWLHVALASLALFVLGLFVDVGKAKSQHTVDELDSVMSETSVLHKSLI